jgi:CRISPR/Cas system CSM-associated protein Csm3 (group 7 of RAMP superfamily)
MARFDRSGGGQPPLPKPYGFVPIPDKRMNPEKPAGHDSYAGNLLTGKIEGTLVALSPIHIASGNIELTGRQPSLVKAHFRCGGRPTIPGSSLKGAIRSIVEAISHPPSCLRVTQARFDNLPPNVRRCTKPESLCIACRMFGAMGYLGQVHFSDAILQQGDTEVIQIPSLFAPRTREQIYFERGKVKGRKFYMHGQSGKTAPGNVPIEACSVGSQFSLHVDFENLSDSQLALLLTALGQSNPKLFPKLGGGKPACCGSLEVTNVTVTTVSARAAAVDFDLKVRTENVESLVGATRSIDRDCLNQLAKILAYPGERPCPDRNY